MGVSAFKLISAGSDGKSIRDTKVQASHGFAPGDVIRYNVPLDGSSEGWTAAVGQSPIEAEVAGVVETVNGTDEFTVVYQGEISLTNMAGITTAGEDVFFLSDVDPGKMSSTPPVSGGHVIKPVMTRIDPAIGIVTNYIGTVIGGRATVSLDAVQPTGTIMPYAGNPAFIPNSWSMCDGQHLSVTEFQELFDRIGKTYGFRQRIYYSSEYDATFAEGGPDEGTTVTQVVDDIVMEGEILPDTWNSSTRTFEIQVFHTKVKEAQGSGAFSEIPDSDIMFKDGYSLTLTVVGQQRTIVPIAALIHEFRKPDLRGRTILGLSEGIPYGETDDGLYMESFLENNTGFESYMLGQEGGEEEHQLTIDELARHIHSDIDGEPSPHEHPHPHPGDHDHPHPHTQHNHPHPHIVDHPHQEGHFHPDDHEDGHVHQSNHEKGHFHPDDHSSGHVHIENHTANHPHKSGHFHPGLHPNQSPHFKVTAHSKAHPKHPSTHAHIDTHTKQHVANHVKDHTADHVSNHQEGHSHISLHNKVHEGPVHLAEHQIGHVHPRHPTYKEKARNLGGGGFGVFDREAARQQRQLNINYSPTPAPSDLTSNKRAMDNAERRSIGEDDVKPTWIPQDKWDEILTGQRQAPWPLISKMYSQGGQRSYGGADGDGFVGDDKPHNNMQPYLALNYIIKVNSVASAAYVDGLDLSLGVSNLTDTEDDATYDTGDVLVYHGGQSPGLLNKWKAFRLFDGWTADIDLQPNQGFKFFMPGASGSAVGPRGAVTFGAQLRPQNKSSVVASYGDIELGAYAGTNARLIDAGVMTPSQPTNYISLNGSNDGHIVTDSKKDVANVISSMTSLTPTVFGQNTFVNKWTVGRGGQGGGLSGASADGADGAGNKKYEEILRVTDTGRIGLLTDTEGLDSNATGVVYGSGYTANGKAHTGMHINGGLRLRRGNTVIDGITTDMTTTHALQDNEVPTVGAVKTYVDAKMEADPTANTIRAMVSGVFDLKSVGVTSADHPNHYVVNLNNLTDNTSSTPGELPPAAVAGSMARIGTFLSTGTTPGVIVNPVYTFAPNDYGADDNSNYRLCTTHQYGDGNHNQIAIQLKPSDANLGTYFVNIFAQQLNT
tara:strand:- start:8437 stop:11766 length:3330 start_codon:yes stop_codon:yes gene_type:complete